MRLKATITLEFEGEARNLLTAALTRGIGELRRSIQYADAGTGASGIKQDSVKIYYTAPEIS
jgi:hypothetical protein